jgi:hypothetical protein
VLALFSIIPPLPHPGMFICQHFLMNVDQVSYQEFEDDLNLSEIEDDLKFFENGRRPQFSSKKEDYLNFKVNGSRPEF